MYFECFSGKALFGLHFRIDLKIFSSLMLFFMLDAIRRIIDCVNWFIYVTWLIDLSLKSSNGFSGLFGKFDFGIIFRGRKSISKIHNKLVCYNKNINLVLITI